MPTDADRVSAQVVVSKTKMTQNSCQPSGCRKYCERPTCNSSAPGLPVVALEAPRMQKKPKVGGATKRKETPRQEERVTANKEGSK